MKYIVIAALIALTSCHDPPALDDAGAMAPSHAPALWPDYTCPDGYTLSYGVKTWSGEKTVCLLHPTVTYPDAGTSRTSH